MMLCYTSITLQYVNVDVKPKIVSAHKRVGERLWWDQPPTIGRVSMEGNIWAGSGRGHQRARGI